MERIETQVSDKSRRQALAQCRSKIACAAVVIAAALLPFAAPSVSHAEAPYQVAWARQIGTSSTDYSYGVAVDASGNAYISGTTDGSLGGANQGLHDAFLVKYNGSGNLLWSRQIGTSGYDYGNAVAVDASGNAYLSGGTGGDLGGTNAGSHDAFLLKYDGSGSLLWSRQIGTSKGERSCSVAVDASGNAYISGWTYGSLGGTKTTGTGYTEAFLFKYDGSGNVLWSRQFGASGGSTTSSSVALDASGNAYISGWTDGSLGGTNAGGSDAILVKYDASGSQLWARQIGSSSTDYSYGVAVDASGNAYISGTTYGSLARTIAGGIDAFLVKYDSSGNLLWARQMGGDSGDRGYSVAVDASGNAYMTGHTYVSHGGAGTWSDDPFLVKYDGSGNLLWWQQIFTLSEDRSLSVALDASGNAYMSGYTDGSLGGTNAGGDDAFLVKFTPEPGSIMLLLAGALALLRRRTKG